MLSGKWTFHICHIPPSIGLDRGVENRHFFALCVGILASNLDWKLVRGPSMNICWSFVDCASCNLRKPYLLVGNNQGFGGSEGGKQDTESL